MLMQWMPRLLSVKTIKYDFDKDQNMTYMKQHLADVVYTTDLNILLLQVKHFLSRHVNKSFH